jgi:hypothetical protein
MNNEGKIWPYILPNWSTLHVVGHVNVVCNVVEVHGVIDGRVLIHS